MATAFSWIDATKLPSLGAEAQLQPLRGSDGVPTPGGLVCPAAAHTSMVIHLCVPVINPMYAALAHHVAARTCSACGARVQVRAAACSTCDAKPPTRCSFDADAVQCSTWSWGAHKPPKDVLALGHVVAPALFARPTSVMPDGRPNDDDLTKHLATIVRMDNRCRRTAKIHGAASPSHAAARHQLQRAVHKYYGYKPPGCAAGANAKHDVLRHGQPGSNTGLKFRLNGKTGRMRGSLLGWRLGDVARCVAQPAPGAFDVDVVIVPQAIAKALGNLGDGAVCLLNRQPTLGVGSIFAVRARVSRNPSSYVLQVSPWLCATLNLDFDGDEVNLHVIKSKAAQYEARLLCGLDSIMRCRITGRVRLKPCHAHVVAHWLKPTPHYSGCTQGAPMAMLASMARCSQDAEATLRQVAVSVGLSDIDPVPALMLGNQLAAVPRSQHVAHLAQAMALQPPRGGLGTLVRSRAKGKFTHLVQLRVCLGQQLRWSKKHSQARGYVDRCFAQGLTVSQAVDHAMSARVGQVDQAVKTRTVGYLRRRLVALMENVTIEHDGTTRLISDRVLQFQHDRRFEAGDAAGSLCATMIGHAAFQASLDAFKHTDANSGSAPGLPAFLRLVAAPSEPAARGQWEPHDASTGRPDPWVKLDQVAHLVPGRTYAATANDVLVRRVMGWTGRHTAVGRVAQLDAAAMLASGVTAGHVAAAVRRAHARDGRPRWDCTVTSCGQRVVLWDDAPWPKSERVTGCHVLPSTVQCAAQAQRAMGPQHVTSCCAATMAVLGVEAARAHFVQMTTHHLGLGHAAVAVHMAADTLFWPGRQLPLTRTGLAQQLPGHALCRAAYETTMAVFADAATQQCVDPGTTISARVCRRGVPRLGSHGPSGVFSTAHGVVERRAAARSKPSTAPRATYEVFDFLSARNNDDKAKPPRPSPPQKKPRLGRSRWGDAPWTTRWSTDCFAKPIS